MVIPQDPRAYRRTVLDTLFEWVAELTTNVVDALQRVEDLVTNLSTTFTRELPYGTQTHKVDVLLTLDHNGPQSTYRVTVTAQGNPHAFAGHELARVLGANFAGKQYTPVEVTRVKPNEVTFAVTKGTQ